MSRIVALTLLLAGAAAAAPPDDARVQAKAHFASGSTFFDAGSYDHAVEEYLAAYRLLPKPDFLFNIAQAYRLKGEKRPALAYYRRYLAETPDGRGSGEAQEYVKQLEQELDQEQPAPVVETPAPVTPVTPPATAIVNPPPAKPIDSPPPAGSRRALWIGIAVGAVVVAALAIGLGLGLGLDSSGSPPPSTFFGTIRVGFQ